MTDLPKHPLVAVDVGNSRIKLGLFHDLSGDSLPSPAKTLSLPGPDGDLSQVDEWLSNERVQLLIGGSPALIDRRAAA